eukprot:gene25154-10785_t
MTFSSDVGRWGGPPQAPPSPSVARSGGMWALPGPALHLSTHVLSFLSSLSAPEAESTLDEIRGGARLQPNSLSCINCETGRLLPEVETLTLECLDTYETSGEGSTEDATVHDVVHLFRACSLSLRLTLVTLVLHECCLDGPAFLALADCHSLTTLKLHTPRITSIEATESITCLTQLRSLEIIMAILDVDVPIRPLLLMPGLTSLDGDIYPKFITDAEVDLCWGSPMMSLEDRRPAALRRLNLYSDQEVQPPVDRAAVLRLLPQL